MWMIVCLLCVIKAENEDKKRVVSILNAIKNSVLDFYHNPETISKLIKMHQPQRLDKVFSKYSKHSKSVREICYYHYYYYYH